MGEGAPERAAGQLLRLWRAGERPDVRDFLARAGPLAPAELAAVLLIDQRERWERGERPPAETYLNAYPCLREAPDAALDLVYGEFFLREERGEAPALDEYLRRFPEYAGPLRLQAELHLAMGPVAPAAGEPTLAEPAGPESRPGPAVPGYEVLGELGRGGMGVVYKARQLALNRLVALKVVLAGAFAGDEQQRRFRAEAEAIARLRHPNFVQVHDYGVRDGHAYLALEFIEGGTLAQQAAGVPQPPRAAARTVETLAAAMHEAHRAGLVHRDLKPANVLLTADGVLKITDFGLVKRLEGGATQTASGALLGTPTYMAPEQVAGGTGAVGPAADVYALGVILYELLTGRPPFQGEGVLEVLRQVQEREPVPPGRLQPGLPRDLETVCLKALAREPARRYASAAALADDLRNFLADRPVAARAVTRWERGWRWCRRNPGVATLGAVAAALLLTLLLGGGVTALVMRERNRAVEAQGRAERAEREVQVRSRLARAAAYRRSGQPGQRFRCLDELREALRLGPTAEERREIRDEAVAALVLPDFEVAHEWDEPPGVAVSLACDASLKRVAWLGEGGTVTLRRLTGGAAEAVATFPAAAHGPATFLWLSPDGTSVVVRRAAPAGKHEFAVWRVDWEGRAVTPRPAIPDPGGNDPHADIIFRPDGRRLAFLGPAAKAVALFDPETGRRCWGVTLAGAAQRLAFRADGEALAVDQGAEIVVLDGASGREARRLRPVNKDVTRVSSLAWHPGGRRLAAACDDYRIHVWDLGTGREAMIPWGGHFDWGIQIGFNHAGDRLVSYDWSRQTRLWDANTGQLLLTLPGFVSPQFSADDTLMGPQRLGGRVRLWRVATGRELREFRPRADAGQQYLRTPVAHAGGRVLAAVSQDGPCFFDLGSGAELASARAGPRGALEWRAFIPPGGWLMSIQGGVLFWPARTAPAAPGVLRVGPPKLLAEAGANGASASPDGRVLVLADGNRALLLNRDGRGPERSLLGPQRDVRTTAVSPDKRWVATCSWNADPVSSVQLWDARTGRLEHRLPLRDQCYWAWFSPDSRWLVTTAFGVECRLWEVGTWREVRRYAEAAPAFTPDGAVLALGDVAGQVRLLAPGTDREFGRLTGPGPVWYDPAGFTPDAAWLIAGAHDHRAAYAWDLRALREQLRELGLDWDLPPLPPPSPGPPPRVEVDRGALAHDADFPNAGNAVALFTLALALQPANPEAHLQRGRAFGRLNRHREAVADYGAFLALARPDDPRRAEVLFRRSSNHDKLGDRAAALHDLQKMAALGLSELPWPESAALRCNDVAWGLVKGRGGRPAEALPLARAAVALAPRSPWYRNTLGVALYRLGRWQEAADVLAANLGAFPELAAADLYFLAMCAHRLGDGGRAREWFGRAVRWEEENGARLAEPHKADLRSFRAEAEGVLAGVAPGG